MHDPATTLAALRRLLLALFLLGVVVTSGELLLIGHHEDSWQLVPLVLLGAGLAVGTWRAAARSGKSLTAFRLLMLLFLAGGGAGLWLHYQGNAEFELEMYPSLSGTGLFLEAMTGATPALAPGMMLQLGLLGLASTWRAPSAP